MRKRIRFWIASVFLLLALIGAYGKATHLELLTRIAMGRYTDPPVQIADLQRAPTPEGWMTVRVGELSLQVPAAAISPQAIAGESAAVNENLVRFEHAGVAITAFRPGVNAVPSLVRFPYQSLDVATDPAEEVAIRARAFESDANRFSFWMSRHDASALLGALELRRVMPHEVDRIERVRGRGLEGLMMVRPQVDDCRRMLFDYFALDGQISGCITVVTNGTPAADELARTIVSSAAIGPDDPGLTQATRDEAQASLRLIGGVSDVATATARY